MLSAPHDTGVSVIKGCIQGYECVSCKGGSPQYRCFRNIMVSVIPLYKARVDSN